MIFIFKITVMAPMDPPALLRLDPRKLCPFLTLMSDPLCYSYRISRAWIANAGSVVGIPLHLIKLTC